MKVNPKKLKLILLFVTILFSGYIQFANAQDAGSTDSSKYTMLVLRFTSNKCLTSLINYDDGTTIDLLKEKKVTHMRGAYSPETLREKSKLFNLLSQQGYTLMTHSSHYDNYLYDTYFTYLFQKNN